MPKYTFSIGLIPVQDFIEEATRCRDLRAGSALLSWFTASSLYYLQNTHNAFFIIPRFEDNELETIAQADFKKLLDDVEYSIPNRASGYLEADNEANLNDIFHTLNEKLLDLWQTIYDKVIAAHRTWINTSYLFSYFTKPSLCPVQLIGVAKQATTDNDLENLSIIDTEYANIKLTRPIEPWPGLPIPKCQQCGKREAIGPEEFHDWIQWFKNKLSNELWVKKERYIDQKEALCPTCLLKRFSSYLSKPAFGSTSEIAGRVWLNRAKTIEEFKALLADIEEIKQMDFPDPDSLFFKSSINRYISEEKDNQIKKQLETILNSRKKYESFINSKPNIAIKNEPSSYLAVLMFDGDNMGRHVKENLENHNKLVSFSKTIRKAYGKKDNEIGSEIFYIGGDEGLLLAPMESVFKIALNIQKFFNDTFNSNGKNSKITLSMGVAVFDRERPLGAAIRLARQALAKAKDLKDKNGLTIAVQTASGNVFSSTAHWGPDWQRVSNAVNYISGQSLDQYRLSIGWAYEVEKYLESLPDGQWGKESFRNAVKDEIKRITKRKIQEKDNPASGENVKNSYDNRTQGKRAIDTLWEALDGDNWFTKTLKGRVISEQLHLIAFLCRESGYRVTEGTNKEIGAEE